MYLDNWESTLYNLLEVQNITQVFLIWCVLGRLSGITHFPIQACLFLFLVASIYNFVLNSFFTCRILIDNWYRSFVVYFLYNRKKYFFIFIKFLHKISSLPFITTPSMEITLGSTNCAKMAASLRKSSRSFLEVFD